MKGKVIIMPLTKNKIWKSILCIIAAVLCFAFCIPSGSFADDKKTLTLICRRDNIILHGMKWRLYKVGERSGGDFVLTGDFANYSIDLGDMSEEKVSLAAKTLESYAVADSIAPIAEDRTDENGELTFGNLDNGLYLATGKILQIDDVYYVPSALLLEVSDNGASFSYDAYPKFYFATLGDEVVSYTVKKVWVDDDDAYKARPVSVTVDIFCDDLLDDTVILNEQNNWQYRWVSLDPAHEWRVAERDIPVDYEVSIDFNRTQYLIKNSHKLVQTTTTTNISSTTTTTTTTTRTVSTTAPLSTTKPTTTTTDKLVQTGQLWWPIIPLAGGGVLLLILGALLKPKKSKQ